MAYFRNVSNFVSIAGTGDTDADADCFELKYFLVVSNLFDSIQLNSIQFDLILFLLVVRLMLVVMQMRTDMQRFQAEVASLKQLQDTSTELD